MRDYFCPVGNSKPHAGPEAELSETGSDHLSRQHLFSQWLGTNSWGPAAEPNSPLKEFVPWYLLSQASWYKALFAVDLGLRISFGIWRYRSSKWSFTLKWGIYKSPPPCCLPPPSSSGKGSLQRGEFRELKMLSLSFLMKLANKAGKVDAGTNMLWHLEQSAPLAKSLRKLRNGPCKRMVQ